MVLALDPLLLLRAGLVQHVEPTLRKRYKEESCLREAGLEIVMTRLQDEAPPTSGVKLSKGDLKIWIGEG